MTSSVKRIVAFHIARLQDKNRDVRLKAITELSLLPDVEALDALRHIVEHDADMEVRQAAQEAGRSIFIQLKKEQNVSAG